MAESRRTALIVEIPAADAVVGPWRATLDQSAAAGVPAHVTVLIPFVAAEQLTAEVTARLAAAVSARPAFEASFASTGWFDEAVLFLEPEPRDDFRALTHAVWSAFPDHPPYDGAFDDVTPHLTVGHDQPLPRLRAAESALRTALPLHQLVTEVALWVESDGSWSRRAGFSLAPASADHS